MNSYQKKFKDEINELVLAAIRLGELGYVTSHGGNLSYRVEQKVFLITPTKVVKRKMQFDDIVIIDDHGDVLFESPGRMPTGETPMHLALYRFRPDLNALVHAHPPVLTGFSMVDQDLLTRPLLPEPVLEVGPVLTVPYAEPVSDELAAQFEKYASQSNAWLMQNHGITLGSSEGIERAVDLLEMTEAMAVSASVAFRLGKVGSISIEEVMNMERTLSSRNMPRPGDPRTIKKLTDLFYKE